MCVCVRVCACVCVRVCVYGWLCGTVSACARENPMLRTPQTPAVQKTAATAACLPACRSLPVSSSNLAMEKVVAEEVEGDWVVAVKVVGLRQLGHCSLHGLLLLTPTKQSQPAYMRCMCMRVKKTQGNKATSQTNWKTATRTRTRARTRSRTRTKHTSASVGHSALCATPHHTTTRQQAYGALVDEEGGESNEGVHVVWVEGDSPVEACLRLVQSAQPSKAHAQRHPHRRRAGGAHAENGAVAAQSVVVVAAVEVNRSAACSPRHARAGCCADGGGRERERERKKTTLV